MWKIDFKHFKENNMKLQVKCKICGQLCPSFQFLGLHLKKHNIKAKEYYDTYMKEIGDRILCCMW